MFKELRARIIENNNLTCLLCAGEYNLNKALVKKNDEYLFFKKIELNSQNIIKEKIKNLIIDQCVFEAESSFEGLNLENLSVISATLASMRFTNIKLDNPNFQNAILDFSVFEHCAFVNADFSNASLNGTKFINCTFEETNFSYKSQDEENPSLNEGNKKEQKQVEIINSTITSLTIAPDALYKLKLTNCIITTTSFKLKIKNTAALEKVKENFISKIASQNRISKKI